MSQFPWGPQGSSIAHAARAAAQAQECRRQQKAFENALRAALTNYPSLDRANALNALAVVAGELIGRLAEPGFSDRLARDFAKRVRDNVVRG